MVLPSYAQKNNSNMIVIKGSLTDLSNIHHKVGIVLGEDTLINTIDDNGNFKMNIANKAGFSRPTVATLIYPFYENESPNKKNKVVHLFFLDSDTLTILIDQKQEIVETYGAYENKVNTEFSKLEKRYHSDIQNKSRTSTKAAIDSLSRTYYTQVLDLATKYNNSLSTYNRLFSLFRTTAFPLRDNIHRAIETLDRNFFTVKELEVINDSYITFVQKNTDKENDALWPELQYTTYKSPDFNKLRQSCDYILIDIWGTWCGPCIEQHPYINELAAKHLANDRFKIIGIAIQSRETDWEKYLMDNPSNYFHYHLDPKNAGLLKNQIKIIEVPRYALLRTADNTLVEKRIPFDQIESIIQKYNIK